MEEAIVMVMETRRTLRCGSMGVGHSKQADFHTPAARHVMRIGPGRRLLTSPPDAHHGPTLLTSPRCTPRAHPAPNTQQQHSSWLPCNLGVCRIAIGSMPASQEHWQLQRSSSHR